MELNKHRQAIVRALIHGMEIEKFHSQKGFIAFAHDKEHDYHCTCVITKLQFVDRLCEKTITCSNYGDVWTGLWLDEPLKVDIDGHGNTLFPRWLAEVLNERGLGILEEDIY